MYISKRSRLGSSITQSPAQKLADWSLHNITSLMFATLIAGAWYLLVYFGCSLTLFLGSQVGDIWDKEGDMTAGILYANPITEGIKIAGLFIIIISVIRKAKR